VAWLLLKIQATEQNADAISDRLIELGALSASIEDALADTHAEQAIFGEPGDPPPGIWEKNIVTAMLDESVNLKTLLLNLQTSTKIERFSYSTEIIAEQDWVRATQAQFDPIKINDKLYIVPTWHESPDSEAVNIVLDPGLAFGTGSHPTTHLCLEWLTKQNLTSVLDYGCGSGILAIAAKMLGANKVIGVDIDEQAIIASEYNAKQNQVNILFYDANTFSCDTFDIVVANILSSALMVLAPALANYCKSGGQLALSGILEAQSEDLILRYSEWFDMNPPIQLDAWILLTGTKK
jgi:ribosomal protein L11 methyltransferase